MGGIVLEGLPSLTQNNGNRFSRELDRVARYKGFIDYLLPPVSFDDGLQCVELDKGLFKSFSPKTL